MQRHSGLAATWRPENPCHAFGRYAELRIQREASALLAEYDFDPARCSCPHVLLRPRHLSIKVKIRTTAKANINMPPATQLASCQRDALI